MTTSNLNQNGLSDYYFINPEGKTFQYSRKQSGELLQDLNGAEADIKKYYNNADRNFQITEGLISPAPLFKSKSGRTIPPVGSRILYSYKVLATGYICDDADWHVSSSMYWAWLHRLAMAGVVTFHTVNYVDTARLLVATVLNEQEPESSHDTLKRVILPKFQLKDRDPFIESVMGISHAYNIGIGEVKAKALQTGKINTIAKMCNCQPLELTSIPGIGNTLAEKISLALHGGELE